MFDIVNDGYNNYDENLKKVKLSELSAIFIKPKMFSSEFFFFERFNDIWTYENIENKYDYKISNDETVETIVEQLKNDNKISDDFVIRVYTLFNKDKADFIKFVLPGGRRNLLNKELFAEYELKRLGDVNYDIVKEQDSEEAIEKFKHDMNIVHSDVTQLIRVFSAQAHTNESLNMTFRLVSQILSEIPLTAITDDGKYDEGDWRHYSELDNKDDSKIKEYLDLEGFEITDIKVNIRLMRIVRVEYKNLVTLEKEVHYYDILSSIFIDSKTGEPYWHKEQSIENIELPWDYRNTNEIVLGEDANLEEYIKYSEFGY